MNYISKIIKASTLVFFALLIQRNVFGQTVWDFPYTGTYSTVTLAPGNYRLEVWGAQGGDGRSYSNSSYFSYGGNGGYSKGEINLSTQTTIYIYVGGKGGRISTNTVSSGSTALGGYNGGGSGLRYGMSGGGGATHIATYSGTLEN